MKLIIEKITQQDTDNYKTEFYKHLLKHFIMDYEYDIKKGIGRKDLLELLKAFIKELPNNIPYSSLRGFTEWAYGTLLQSLPDKIMIGEILTRDYVEENYNPNFIIPNGVKIIDKYCFNTLDIESVYIPASVVEIQNNAFDGCHKLTSITIPDSVTTIGTNAFACCDKLTNISISNSLKNIENYTFSGCEQLSSINIPKSIEKIGNGAFNNCNQLKLDLDLRDYKKLKLIGSNAFYHTQTILFIDLKSLISGTIDVNNDVGCKIVSDETIKSITLNKNTCHPIVVRSLPNLEKIVLEEDVDELEYDLFKGCVNLRSIICKSDIKYISSNAFDGCKKLKEISIPDVRYIGSAAFRGCEELKELPYWKGLEQISRDAFENCINLTTIRLNDSFNYLGRYVFYNCKNLKSLFVPDNTSIQTDTFTQCSLEELSLPNTLRKIAQRTLKIPSLKKLIYRGTKEEFLKNIGDPQKYLPKNCEIIYKGD